ncbi:MAG TPA: 50S ribosomal protein L4 [Candidatus Dojkabacteria bacterium]|jgi:large subunit ribosomal protein L4|nr:50S ribosomal protein L4 [Candidatus Dojkabacteria bacterium]HNW32991.1 50S ribosomal protein L4 [Candidatus Dojkabacteria bacterium]HOZ44472.1 50S ribosomal protein L4 [Candidatus Dojkabacteria bacterium]HQC39109.1 50S ribosomal protein L4 [Candidatus Dojkabacteria bacterium]HRY74385.1 50S ribosomal protein L4 [Candidatus Dojkabacteria bacterium]
MAETKSKTKVEKKVAEIKRNPLVWDLPYNADLVAQVLYVYRSNERKSTANVKGRGEVSGGGKKPWKQKGTGRARAGSTRSTIWVGGGVAFGNVGDRNWNRKINKKMAKKATCVMLSENLRNKTLEFMKFSLNDVKKLRDEMKKNSSKSALVITDNVELGRKIRNIEKLDVVSSEKLNAKNIAKRKYIYVDNEVIEMLEKRLTNEK